MESVENIIDYIFTMKEWFVREFLGDEMSDDEYYAAVFIQRRFREKLYRRRCKYTQATEHSSWFMMD
jgi:hypothetical protein